MVLIISMQCYIDYICMQCLLDERSQSIMISESKR